MSYFLSKPHVSMIYPFAARLFFFIYLCFVSSAKVICMCNSKSHGGCDGNAIKVSTKPTPSEDIAPHNIRTKMDSQRVVSDTKKAVCIPSYAPFSVQGMKSSDK